MNSTFAINSTDSLGNALAGSLTLTLSTVNPPPTPVLTKIIVSPYTATLAAGATQQFSAQGFDQNRLALLVAVLEKRLGLRLEDQDVFLNVVGGVTVEDPAADLAVALAVASSFLDKPIPRDMAVLGEVGLSAEVRSVSHMVVRLHEAEKLGFKRCLVPKNNLKMRQELKLERLQLVPVSTLKEALDVIRSS